MKVNRMTDKLNRQPVTTDEYIDELNYSNITAFLLVGWCRTATTSTQIY